MIGTLAARHAALAAAAGQQGAQMTVVFDAGQNSEANFALLAGTKLHHVGMCRPAAAVPCWPWPPPPVPSSMRASPVSSPPATPAAPTTAPTARAILTHSPEPPEHQARGFDGTTLAKATRQLGELAATLQAPRARPGGPAPR